MPGDDRTDDYPAHDYDSYDGRKDDDYTHYTYHSGDEKIARRIADRVMKVKSPLDRIGGLYEMAYKGALAGLTYGGSN